MEKDELEAAGTFAETTRVPEGSSIVDLKWHLKWKGDEHGMIDKAKAGLLAKGYSQVE